MLQPLAVGATVLAVGTLLPAQAVFPYPFQIDDFENGLRLVTVPTGHPDIVTLYIVVATGSRNEVEPGKSGFAHFFEHMMFRGSEHFSSARRTELLKGIGADGNAYTTNDYTAYHLTFGKTDLDLVLELEADRFQRLKYEPPAFRTEAMAVFGEYNKNSSSPTEKLFEVLQDTAFDRHTYKHTTMGFLRDIVQMPRQFEYSREFYARWYRPEYTTIVLVGDVDPKASRALVQEHFGAWPRGSHRVEIPREPAQTAPRQVHIPWPTPTQPWVAVAFKGPAFSTADREMATLDVISTLAFGEDSELYKQLVVREQKVTSLLAHFPDSTDPYLLTILARLQDGADAAYVRDAILATCEALATAPVDPADLARVKRHQRYAFAAGLDSAESIAGAIAGYIARTRTPSSIDELFARYAEVTPADVQRVAGTYFVTNGRTIATLAAGQTALLPAPTVKAPCDAVTLRTESPLVDFRLVFRTGAADDPPGRKGLAHVTARMLAAGGTQSRSYEEIVATLFPIAASIESQTDKQMTTLHGTVHRDNLEAFWTILRDAITKPGFRPQDLARIKLETRSFLEVELRGDNDEELGKEVLYAELYRDHPFGHHNAGALADLEAITLDDVRAFHRDHFTADRLWVGLAGGYPEGFAIRARQELADGLQGDPGAPVEQPLPPSPADVTRSRMTIVQKTTRATGMHIGWPMEVTRRHEDFVALWLVRSYLGEHRDEVALLYQRLREVRGLNYGDYAYVEYFPRGMYQFKPDPNLARTHQIFQIWLRPVPPENAAFALRAACFELRKLVEHGIGEAAFQATREFLTRRVATLVATQSARLGYAIDSAFYNRDAFVDQVRAGLANLTCDSVNAAIRRHLRTDRVQFVVVTEDAQAFVDSALGPQSTITYQSKPAADVLAEDEIIGKTPIGVRREDVRIVPVAEVFQR